MTSWEIIVFESNRGEKFVEEFIKSQQPQTVGKISNLIDLLEKHGSNLGMPHTKKLTATLYELRIRGKQEIRIIYSLKGKNIYLLHAFKKQTPKTPRKEIDIASKRSQILN